MFSALSPPPQALQMPRGKRRAARVATYNEERMQVRDDDCTIIV